MLDWMFIILFLTAIILLLISISEFNEYWALTAAMLSSSLWFILAFGVLELETAYALYNVSSEMIETGYYAYTPISNVFLMYLFSAVGMIMLIYLVVRIFKLYEKKIFRR